MGMGWHREVYPAFCRKPDGEVMFSSIRCGKNASVSVPCLTGWWLGVRRRSAHGVYPLQVVGAAVSFLAWSPTMMIMIRMWSG